MIVVLDACSAIEVVMGRSNANALSMILDSASWVIAPSLFVTEVTNVFWKLHSLENIDITSCENALELALALVDDIYDEKDYYKEMFSMSCMSRHPAYDMAYVVLARRNNAVLCTVDKKLKAVAEKYSVKTA
jgi:predicted nucleic acid-binding protein